MHALIPFSARAEKMIAITWIFQSVCPVSQTNKRQHSNENPFHVDVLCRPAEKYIADKSLWNTIPEISKRGIRTIDTHKLKSIFKIGLKPL